MTWDDFYDRYCDWSESTLKTRISSLEDIGAGEDVVDVILNLPDDKSKAQLVRKAMKLGVVFTQDDYMGLDGEFSDELYAEIGKYGGFYIENPYFNENDFDWDEFYNECSNLPEDMILRCIPRIKKFGDTNEVVDAILSVSYPADDALFDRAVACGVRFTDEQLRMMGRENIFFDGKLKEFISSEKEHTENIEKNIGSAEQKADKTIERIQNPRKSKKLVGRAVGLGALIGIFKGLSAVRKKHSGKCDGDCDNCPAHYGYRYGRWYYGHGHQHGCVFHGNGGYWGKTYKN